MSAPQDPITPPAVTCTELVGDGGKLRAQMRALASKWQEEGEALTNYKTYEDTDEALAHLRPTHEERLDRFVMLHNCAVELEMLASGQLVLVGRRVHEGSSPTDPSSATAGPTRHD